MPVEVGKVGSRGQVTIPKEIREKEDLEPGDYVAIEEEDGKVSIEKLDVEKWVKRVKKIEEKYEGPTTSKEVAELIDD